MKKILNILKALGKKIGNVIVDVILSIVYILVIGPYSLFIKFNREKNLRDYQYKKVDADRMF